MVSEGEDGEDRAGEDRARADDRRHGLCWFTHFASFSLAAGVLGGCAGQFSIPPGVFEAPRPPPPAAPPPSPQAPAIIERDTGETPAICYVRARHFQGLVPLSCNEAQIIRP
jgi:hypothetical protein